MGKSSGTPSHSSGEAVLAVVEKVLPSLEKRRGYGYEGPGEDVRCVIDGLLEDLRVPTQSTNY